jgi:hypothetical protein
MMIIMSGAYAINVSRNVIDYFRSINHKNIMIINDTSRVPARMMPQLGAPLLMTLKVSFTMIIFL